MPVIQQAFEDCRGRDQSPSCLMVFRSGSLGFVDCILLPEMDAWVTYPMTRALDTDEHHWTS